MGVVKFSYYTFFIEYCNFFGSKGREKKAESNLLFDNVFYLVHQGHSNKTKRQCK